MFPHIFVCCGIPRYIETDLAWSSSLEYVRIMVRHEACPQEEI